MWRGGSVIVAAAGLLLGASCGGGGPEMVEKSSVGDAEPSRGRILFLVHCVSCHGKDGRLGLNGAKILPDTKLGHAEIVTQIRHGKGLMTAFDGIISPAEIDSVASYVLTLKGAPDRQ